MPKGKLQSKEGNDSKKGAIKPGTVKIGAAAKIRNKLKRAVVWKQEKALKKKLKKERQETREKEAKELGDKVCHQFFKQKKKKDLFLKMI